MDTLKMEKTVETTKAQFEAFDRAFSEMKASSDTDDLSVIVDRFIESCVGLLTTAVQQTRVGVPHGT